MMSVGREYALLLTPKFLSARRRGLTGPGRWGRAAMVLGVGAAAWPFIYVALTRLLRTLRGVEEVGPLLASKLLALGLLMFLGILLLSNLIAALSSFFLSRDLPWIRAAPVDWLSVYLTRLTETLVSSSWMVVLMLVPMLAAYWTVYDGGWQFVALSVAAVVPFLVIPAAVGSAITLLLVRLFPARRSKDILGIVAVASAGLVILLLRVLRPERLVNPESYRNLVDFMAALRGPSSPWLPSQWGADALAGFLQGGFDPFLLILLWTTAAGTVTVGAMLHRSLYPVCFTRAQEGTENRIRHHSGWTWFGRTVSGASLQQQQLVLKDVRIFFRDTTQWSQLIILGVLVVVYVYNMRVLPLSSGEMITRYLITLVVFLNLALSGFVLAAIAARFVFPALSLEGRTLWMLKSAPLEARTILGAKYWVGAVPLTALAVLLTGVTNFLLGVPTGLAVLSLVSTVALSLAFTAQALAWGVYYPEFESENAAQIPTSIGGLLFMLGAVINLGTVLALQIWILRGFLMSGLPGREPRSPLLSEIALALAVTLLCCAVAGGVSYQAAVRRFDRLDG
jgi:ABC-2 type transport system permease protein